jgi:hypothetical protein
VKTFSDSSKTKQKSAKLARIAAAFPRQPGVDRDL